MPKMEKNTCKCMGTYHNINLTYEPQNRLQIYSVLTKTEIEGLQIFSFTPVNSLIISNNKYFHKDIFPH
jgi:hypothetical protein